MMTRSRYLVGAVAGVAVGALLMLFVGPFTTSAQEARQNASNTLVSCEPSQQVVVRHTVVNNELQVSTQCVGATMATSADYISDGARPVYVSARPIAAPRTVASVAPARAASTSAPVRTEAKRSWQKTALIIGGSAGAGAGVGAIAGGKKGALIGAAIGGGAASIFEAMKRNKQEPQ
jgi:hypothetical protein